MEETDFECLSRQCDELEEENRKLREDVSRLTEEQTSLNKQIEEIEAMGYTWDGERWKLTDAFREAL